MATVVLAAAGAALGGTIGGTIAGIGAAAIGQAAGSIVGGLIDQRIMGGGSQVVERGRAGSLRVQTAEEGAPIPRIAGRMRVAGQVIWSTRFRQSVRKSGGGKGGGPSVRSYSYTISFAVALAEGPIDRIGRVWADGRPMDLGGVAWRLHRGDEEQGPDPLIAAVEGAAPAFRGVAYLVFEELPVGPYGNRMPQISAEVFRRPRVPEGLGLVEETLALDKVVRAVAMSPGTGEFVYDTEPVRLIAGEGKETFANLNAASDRTDAVVSLDQLEGELPAARAVSLVASWFGTDLRCAECRIMPGVEYAERSTAPHVWRAGGVGRSRAHLIGRDAEGRPVFGGTPADGSLIRYIRECRARGLRVMFYPFILMDIPAGNALPDPWSGGVGQAAYPWRGRITTSLAPGVGGVDGTPAAADEVAAFFGMAAPGDFSVSGETISYSGPDEWGLRRFVLHYAHLCAAAGGVEGFCIGSELRSLTQIRSGRTEYPAVEALRALAADVRAVLGQGTKLGYAADWSEWFGHQPQDGSGDRLFHLDPLWADPAIDFVGIDWYPPLTDWRDVEGHLDGEEAGSIHDLGYLSSRFGGGEGFDWYYASEADRAVQLRTPITDGAHGEPWVWRYKDLRGWWENPHHARIDGARQAEASPWVPRSKPIWLTEIGCAAVDKGTNQPNLFFDPKSSESGLPAFSSGARDDLIQRRMLQAAALHWGEAANNPVSPVYGGPMVDLANSYAWTWDARPWPAFPGKLSVWSDGGAHGRGHWISGRAASASLDAVVAEICAAAGVEAFDVSGLAGVVDGFGQGRTQPPREALEALMLAYGFDAVESGGVLRFVMRGRGRAVELDEAEVAAEGVGGGRDLERARAEPAAAASRLRVGFVRADGDYQAGSVEVANPEAGAEGVQGSDLPIAMTRAQAGAIAERWARESEAARETLRFALPLSHLALEPGDVVRFGGPGGPVHRIDRISDGVAREVEATRVEPALYAPPAPAADEPRAPGGETAVPGRPGYRLLDLPWAVFGGSESAAWLAAWAEPWPGAVALYGSDRDEDYAAVGAATRPATVARLLAALPAAQPWRWMRGAPARVELLSGALASADALAVANGANLCALASPLGGWELIQFREAVLQPDGTWALSGLLRGLGGTEPLIGDPTPAGALLIPLDAGLLAFEPGEGLRGLERHYRIGPASADPGDESFAHAVWTWEATALRPHAPVRVRAVREGDGAIRLTWVRRARRDVDSWPSGETPLQEAEERYRVRVRLPGGVLAREGESTAPEFLYAAAAQAADGVTDAAVFEVAQVSAEFGPGFDGKVSFHG
mgnify:CR=1 FL=1